MRQRRERRQRRRRETIEKKGRLVTFYGNKIPKGNCTLLLYPYHKQGQEAREKTPREKGWGS